jgi:hypothetical protein
MARGGSAQDRRRARRAAARTERLARVVSPPPLLEPEVIPEPLAAEPVSALDALRRFDAALELEKISADADELAGAQSECAACGHMGMAHAGGDNMGACSMANCDCAGFEAASASTEEAAIEEAAIEEAATEVTVEYMPEVSASLDPSGRLVRLRLDNIVFAEVPLPAEHEPGAEMPPRAPSPAAPADELPTRAAALRWTADFVPEGVLTDDGRAMAPGSLSWRELPLSLMAMTKTADGHDGAEVSGRIDRIWREGTMIRGEGMFDAGEFGLDIARMVDERVLRGISVDIAVSQYETGPKSQWFDEDGNWREEPLAVEDGDEEPSLVEILYGPAEDTVYVVTEGVIGAVTVCPFPAFADASISLAASLVAASSPAIWTLTQQHRMGIVGCAPCAEREALIAAGRAALEDAGLLPTEPSLTAAAAGLAPLLPPADWFQDPELEGLTALTIDDEGRVFGHAAAWDTCHLAFPNACTTAPHSRTDYSYFHLKEIECEEGTRVSCGTVTLDASHAGQSLGREAATAHYDHTGLQAIDVRVGEDEWGIWVAGALRPDVDAEKARKLRGSVLSGDWRNVDGNLELVALLAVNVPGFPVPRARALVAMGAEGDDEVLALVAAGIQKVALELPEVPEETRRAFHAEMEALRDRAAGEFSALAERAHTAA